MGLYIQAHLFERQETPHKRTIMERAYAIRRSMDADQGDLMDLELPEKADRKMYFGCVLMSSVIETSLLSLTATDPDRAERILGFAAFDCRPPGELGEHEGFNAYVDYKYDLPPVRVFLVLPMAHAQLMVR